MDQCDIMICLKVGIGNDFGFGRALVTGYSQSSWAIERRRRDLTQSTPRLKQHLIEALPFKLDKIRHDMSHIKLPPALQLLSGFKSRGRATSMILVASVIL